MQIRLFIWCFFLFCGAIQIADAQKLVGSTNKNPVGTGDVFEVTYTINASGENFTPPAFKELQVVGGPNESQNMAIVNGSTTVSISIGYDLMAAREGEYLIPPASITVNGKKLTSNSVVIRVEKARACPQAGAPPRQNVGGPTAADTRDIGKSVFIKAIVDKANVYQG